MIYLISQLQGVALASSVDKSGQNEIARLRNESQKFQQISSLDPVKVGHPQVDSFTPKYFITNKTKPSDIDATQQKLLRKSGVKVGAEDLYSDSDMIRQMTILACVIVLLISLILLLLKNIRPETSERLLGRQSKMLPRLIATAVAIFLALVIVLAWYALNRLEEKTRKGVGENLLTVNESSLQSLMIWKEGKYNLIHHIIKERGALEAVKQQLVVPREAIALQESKSLQNLRQIYEKEIQQFSIPDFFVIAPDRINIASLYDNDIGSQSSIELQRTDLLDRAFAGETVFIPPIFTGASSSQYASFESSTISAMFVAAPVNDKSGQVVAVVALRLDHAGYFSKIPTTAQIGKTGETYAFDIGARLLTDSRFKMEVPFFKGMTTVGGKMVNLRLQDPGGNLLDGFTPRKKYSEWSLTRMAQAAVTGNSGVDINGYRDYRGVPVMGAWRWSDELGIGLATKIDAEEVMAPYYETRSLVFGSLLGTTIVVVLITAFSVWLGEKVRSRLKGLVDSRTSELRDAEYTRNLAMEAAQVGLWSGNIQSGVLEWDERVERMMGLHENTYPDFESWFSVLYPDDKERVLSDFQAAISGEKIYDVEYRVVMPDGKVRYITARGKMTRDEDGAPYRIDGVTLDMTELKQAEHALKESQERFELAVHGSGDALWEYDVRKGENWFSTRFVELLGYKEGELSDILGAMKRAVHSDDKDKIIEAFAAHIERDVPYDIEYRMRTKQGEWRWFSARAKSLRDAEGRVYRTSGTISDITERKNAEARVVDSERRLDLALRSANTGLWDLNVVSGQLDTNDVWSEMLGYQRNELDDLYGDKISRWKSLTHPDDFAMALKHLEEHFQSRSMAYKSEFRMKASDGSWKWILAVGQVVKWGYDGKPVRVLGTHTDISELVKVRQAAEKATRAKSEFLANMSHEIRTPMNAIIGLSHLTLKTDLSPKQYDYISRLQLSANTLLGIINDILDFSKIEAGKLDIESISFQLEDVLSNLANLIAIKAEEKGLELLFKINQDVPPGLIGDPLRLGQVLINLVSNAVKFTETGEIVVVTSVVQKDESMVTLQFSVQDSGIGLTKDQCAGLFQAFSQADTSTTRKYGGTGLGLAICKRLCGIMGGDIIVDSVPGEGSSFIFTAEFGLDSEVKVPHIPAMDLRNKSVLVVDNNSTSRQILQEMLESMTFVVAQSASGEEALNDVIRADKAGTPFEAVFMDWQMPDMNGIISSKKIRGENLSLQPKIIMVTAYGREEVIQQADEVNLEGFIVKPVHRSLLFDVTLQAFAGNVQKQLYGARIEKGQDIEELKQIRGARILLAEDNETNQQVAQEIMEQAALVVDIASDGKKTIDMAKTNQYDVILMDIQMPEISGMEATKIIRSLQSPVKDIPIIAMTAHAMAGDREKSLEAGMNDHITKPIDPDKLFSTLLAWIKPGNRKVPKYLFEKLAEQEKLSEEIDIPNIPHIDVNSGLSRVGGNEKFYMSLLEKFYKKNQDATEQITKALAEGNIELGIRLAHTMKSVAGNLGAKDLQDFSADIETAIRNNSLENIDELLATFDKAIKAIINGLKDIIVVEDGEKKEEGKAGDLSALRKMLDDLIPYLREKKPKPCKEIMEKINGYDWPSEYSSDVVDLTEMIGRYKFKDAESIRINLVDRLRKMETSDD